MKNGIPIRFSENHYAHATLNETLNGNTRYPICGEKREYRFSGGEYVRDIEFLRGTLILKDDVLAF